MVHVIRKLNDATELHRLRLQLAAETKNMMFEIDEVPSVKETALQLGRLEKIPHGTAFGAYVGSSLVGFITLERGRVRRNNGIGILVMGILQSCSGRGIGHNLMSSSIAWAKNEGLYRLSFDVRADNYRALELYDRLGFEIEGKMKHAALIDGELVDKYLMAMLM